MLPYGHFLYSWCVVFVKAPVELPVIGQSMPVMWFYLLMNVITQYPFISWRPHKRNNIWRPCSLFDPYPSRSDTCVSAACSFWPPSVRRSRLRWWWRCVNSSVSSYPSCTSRIPSQRGTGRARPWCFWGRCSTLRCYPAFTQQSEERNLTRRRINSHILNRTRVWTTGQPCNTSSALWGCAGIVSVVYLCVCS